MMVKICHGHAEMFREGRIQDEQPASLWLLRLTPYAFHPKVGHKLVATDVDLGQGLLDCLAELHERLHNDQHPEGDWLVSDEAKKG